MISTSSSQPEILRVVHPWLDVEQPPSAAGEYLDHSAGALGVDWTEVAQENRSYRLPARLLSRVCLR